MKRFCYEFMIFTGTYCIIIHCTEVLLCTGNVPFYQLVFFFDGHKFDAKVMKLPANISITSLREVIGQ